MRLFSPAKINLFLKVTNRREDGFHELQTIMQAIDFYDIIDLELDANVKGIQMISSHSKLPLDESNLVWKAIDLFYKKTKLLSSGIRVYFRKNIPIGAGLGGGSSNAITVLSGLNRHYGNPLSIQEMEETASLLGSDTAFFLEPGTWLCEGRGERRVRKISPSKYCFLLILPDFSCSTKKVYSHYIFDLTKSDVKPSLLELELVSGSSVEKMENAIYNNLLDTVINVYPRVGELIKNVRKLCHKPVFLSGSGSTLFMVFSSEKEARESKNKLELFFKNNVSFKITHSITS